MALRRRREKWDRTRDASTEFPQRTSPGTDYVETQRLGIRLAAHHRPLVRTKSTAVACCVRGSIFRSLSNFLGRPSFHPALRHPPSPSPFGEATERWSDTNNKDDNVRDRTRRNRKRTGDNSGADPQDYGTPPCTDGTIIMMMMMSSQCWWLFGTARPSMKKATGYLTWLGRVDKVEGLSFHLFIEESCKEASLPRETLSCKVRPKERTGNEFSIDHKSGDLWSSQDCLRGEKDHSIGGVWSEVSWS